MSFEYTIEQPPDNWKKYPKSFLRAAVPILNQAGSWPKAEHILAEIGLTQLFKAGGCPVIKSFKAEQRGLLGVNKIIFSYEIEANSKLDYLITISMYDKHKRFISAEPFSSLNKTGSIEEKRPVKSVALTIRAIGVDGVVDTKKFDFTPFQPSLF